MVYVIRGFIKNWLSEQILTARVTDCFNKGPLVPFFLGSLRVSSSEQSLLLSSCVLCEEGKRWALSELSQAFKVAAAQTSTLGNLVLSRQPGCSECHHPFIDKPMVITELTVASTRPLGLGSKLYPSNKACMLNKDLTQFMQSLSREHQNRASERETLLAGCATLENFEIPTP